MKHYLSKRLIQTDIIFYSILFPFILFVGCNSGNGQSRPAVPSQKPTTSGSSKVSQDTLTTYKPIPVLCYHQIRDWTARDSKASRVYIVPVQNFKDQIQMLHDSGYQPILPGQLVCYLQHKCSVPKRPILITFDDGTEGQYNTALPELDKAGFKATFFIITVTINHPNYLSSAQIKELLSKGHEIGCHTWDHHRADRYSEEDWNKQLAKPMATLQSITGKPTKYFAYPFGLWNEAAVDQLKKHNITAAFRLWDKKEPSDSLLAVKRILVSGYWNNNDLFKALRRAGY